MADEPNKEFTIQVQFSGVEESILGGFKKQIDSVANAITLINDTMKEQIKALESIQKNLKDINAEGGGGGYRGGGGGGGGTASHLAGQPHGDSSEVVRAVQDLGRNLERVTGGSSSLFGARGLTSGYRQWDQENSFEIPQFPGAGFTFQDALRQAGSAFGVGGYSDRRSGNPLTQGDVQALHDARETNPNQNVWRAQQYIDEATSAQTSWWQKPWKQAFGHIEGTENYINSLGEGVEQHPLATKLAKAQVVSPYFSRGGVFNPSTYGLGISGLRQKAAIIGNGYGRFGAQFGEDTTFSPFSDSGHQYFGAQWGALRNSWFGMNPFLSTAQAGQINASIAGMGYSSGTAESMRNTMSDVTQHTNIGINDQAAIIDKSFRWGYANLQQLADFMKHDIPQAATAARMNVGQFAAQLHTVGSSLGAAQGMNPFVKMQQVSDLSIGTGVDPGTAGQIMGDSGLTYLAGSIQAQKTGQFSLGALQNAPNNAALYGQAVALRVRTLTGLSPDEIADLQKRAASGDEDAKTRLTNVQSQLSVLAMSGQGIPGAGTIQEITQRWTGRGIRDTNAAAVSRSFGDTVTAKYDAALTGYVDKHGKSLDDLQGALRAGDAAVDKYAQSQFHGAKGRHQLISEIQKMSHDWSEDGLGKVLGHHTEYSMQGGHRVGHDVIGDSSKSIKDIMSGLHKQLAEQTKKREDKNSKGGDKVVISMAPGLANLLKMNVAPGNSGYSSGTGPSAPYSDPTDGSSVTVGG